ncbi:unnamed protein product, partial [marine sediment metagenome]
MLLPPTLILAARRWCLVVTLLVTTLLAKAAPAATTLERAALVEEMARAMGLEAPRARDELCLAGSSGAAETQPVGAPAENAYPDAGVHYTIVRDLNGTRFWFEWSRAVAPEPLATRTWLESPVSLICQALARPDLVEREENQVLRSRAHYVIALEVADQRIRVFIDPMTWLPVRVESVVEDPYLGPLRTAVGYQEWRRDDRLRLPSKLTYMLQGHLPWSHA